MNSTAPATSDIMMLDDNEFGPKPFSRMTLNEYVNLRTRSLRATFQHTARALAWWRWFAMLWMVLFVTLVGVIAWGWL